MEKSPRSAQIRKSPVGKLTQQSFNRASSQTTKNENPTQSNQRRPSNTFNSSTSPNNRPDTSKGRSPTRNQRRLRSPPPPPPWVRPVEALPDTLPDEVFSTGHEDIPLLMIRSGNSMFVHDKGNDIHFLIDTGAEKSIIPAHGKDNLSKDTHQQLLAANGTSINCYGEQVFTLTFSPRHKYNWKFIIADVEEPILGADFLKAHNLLVDIGKKQLIQRDRSRINVISNVSHPEPYQSLIQRFPNLTTINPQSTNTTNTTHF